MRIILERLKLRKDFDTLNFFIRSIFVLGALGLLTEILTGMIFWSFFIEVPLLLLLFKLYFRTYKAFYYSFWTFNIILFSYVVWSLFKSLFIAPNSLCAYIYLLMFLSSLIVSYILSSPIYFPIVNWWEYDFRFRRDVKVEIEIIDRHSSENKKVEGRLIDFRREAAGIQCFEELNVGSSVVIHFLNELDGNVLNAEIVSRRKYSLGRPYVMGVKIDRLGSKTQFHNVLKFWQQQRIDKKKLRYHGGNQA